MEELLEIFIVFVARQQEKSQRRSPKWRLPGFVQSVNVKKKVLTRGKKDKSKDSFAIWFLFYML